MDRGRELKCDRRTQTDYQYGASLLRAAREAERQGLKQYERIVSVIREDHIAAARNCVKSPDIAEDLIQDINDECNTLLGLLAALQVRNCRSTPAIDDLVPDSHFVLFIFVDS
jgi:hypothetical protein